MKQGIKKVEAQIEHGTDAYGNATVLYHEVATYGGRAVTFRVYVSADSKRSWTVLNVWNGNGWTCVFTSNGNLKTPSSLATRKRAAGRSSFKLDRAVLGRIARAVLQ